MFLKALANVWRSIGTRGLVLLLSSALALALVLKSGFSSAVWGNNRESPLFVLVGMVGFLGPVVFLMWAVIFVVKVLLEWGKLRSGDYER